MRITLKINQISFLVSDVSFLSQKTWAPAVCPLYFNLPSAPSIPETHTYIFNQQAHDGHLNPRSLPLLSIRQCPPPNPTIFYSCLFLFTLKAVSKVLLSPKSKASMPFSPFTFSQLATQSPPYSLSVSPLT